MNTVDTSATCKILVPVYRSLTQFETRIVRHNLSLVSGFKAAIIGPSSKANLLSDTAKELSGTLSNEVDVECFDDRFFKDVHAYSWLLLKDEFYERFNTEDFILICQTDAFLFSDNLKHWLGAGFDFVGAPVFKGKGKPEFPPQFSGMMNGGLSLRHVAGARNALKQILLCKSTSRTRLLGKLGLMRIANFVTGLLGRTIVVVPKRPYEDVVWTGEIAKAVPAFFMPPPETALKFAFECLPQYLFKENGEALPFGCHAFEVYEPLFWREHFPEWAREGLAETKKQSG